ncbi:MAG: response regulator transcription factor [Rhodopseudomonas palustris]|nr:response regulator transcription factor [Rhodopseudomonas palustris]
MNEFSKAQLLVVDDHPIVRHGIVQLLNRQPDMEVVAEADDAESALAQLRERSFNLIVTDISLPGLSGLDLIRRVNVNKDAPPMLVLSMHEESVYAERALNAGARGYVMKQEAPDKLVAAVRKLLGGRHLPVAADGRADADVAGQGQAGHRRAQPVGADRARVRGAADDRAGADLGADRRAHQPLDQERGGVPHLAARQARRQDHGRPGAPGAGTLPARAALVDAQGADRQGRRPIAAAPQASCRRPMPR